MIAHQGRNIDQQVIFYEKMAAVKPLKQFSV